MKRFEYEDAIDRSDLAGVQRAVLRHVVRRAVTQGGDLGIAWPSVADVVACTGFGRTAVKGALTELRRLGWLEVVGRHPGGVYDYRCQVGRKVARRPTPGRETTHSGSGDGPGRETTHPGSGDDHPPVARRPTPGREATTEASQEAFLEAPQEAPPAPPVVQPAESQPSEDKPEAPDEWQQLVDLWNELSKAHGGGHATLTRSKGLGAKLRARAKDHGREAMAGLLRWYWTSQHDRARFLRDKQMGLKTLLRPDNCEEYIGFSREPERWDASNARGHHIDALRKGPQGDEAAEARRLLDQMIAAQQAAEGAP